MRSLMRILIISCLVLYICIDAVAELKYGIGKAQLGMPFREFLKYINYDSIKKQEERCWEVYKKSVLILTLYDKNFLKDLVVRMVNIHSPELVATEGIYVGMPVTELIRRYPNTQLEKGEEDIGEYFAPDKLQKYTKEGNLDTCMLLEVSAEDGSPLANGSVYPTEDFRKKGRIICISIFKFKSF
jgi:hypothetical protein